MDPRKILGKAKSGEGKMLRPNGKPEIGVKTRPRK